MIRYRVRVAPVARKAITAYGVYIADKSGSGEIAERWMRKVYATIDRLEYLPRRFNLAEEDQHRGYEVRRQIIGDYLALYNVNDEARVVNVIGFRHGRRLPRPGDLPDDPS